MKKLISTKQLNYAVAFVATAILLVFILSYSETGNPPRLLQSEPDASPSFYIQQARIKRYDQKGELTYQLDSDHIENIPNTDKASLQQPLITQFNEGDSRWVTSAEEGVLLTDGKQLDLSKQVVAENSTDEMTIRTTAITIYPGKKQAETDQKITLFTAEGFTRSKGMQADLESGEIHLKQNVRGQYNVVPE